jgi:hypothetical protein
MLIAAVLSLIATPLLALELHTLVATPRGSAPAGGGWITLRTTDVVFNNPSAVLFGDVASPVFTLIDRYTLAVWVPRHDPGLVNIHVLDGSVDFYAKEMFGFGVVEHVIVPVSGDGVRWVTDVSIYNDTDHDVPIDPEWCFFIGRGTPCGTPVRRIAPHVTTTAKPELYGWDEIFPPIQDADSLHFSVHVRDLLHPDRPPIEIPALRQRDLRTGRIVLPGVSTSARYRTNLRVFSSAYQVTVTVRDSATGAALDSRTVTRYVPTDVDPFGFVDFRDLFDVPQVRSHERVDVIIDTADYDRDWALLTLTDNATEQVTTFMPQ